MRVISDDAAEYLQDTTFEMEKRRNRPEKYNRELVHKTVKAMERISEVGASPSLDLLRRLPCITQASGGTKEHWLGPVHVF